MFQQRRQCWVSCAFVSRGRFEPSIWLVEELQVAGQDMRKRGVQVGDTRYTIKGIHK